LSRRFEILQLFYFPFLRYTEILSSTFEESEQLFAWRLGPS